MQTVTVHAAEEHAKVRTAKEQALDLVAAGLLTVVTYAVYGWAAGTRIDHQSDQPHFVLLADALLHGHLWIDPKRAAHLADITLSAGQYYVAFPPMPAFLMLPFVALFGPGFHDVLFSVVLGSVNVGLTYILVRRLSLPGAIGAGLPIGRGPAIAAAALLGFGTVHFYTAVTGTVWFVAHVVAVTFVLLYLLECAGQARPLVAGMALGAAFLARTPTIFGLLFWMLITLRQKANYPQIIWRIFRFAIPLTFAVALLLGQNVVRFGSPFDFGYLTMRINPTLAQSLHKYGQFNLHFLPRNLAALLITPPLGNWAGFESWLSLIHGPTSLLSQLSTPASLAMVSFPIQFNPWGTGLWAVSPAFVFALRLPRRRDAVLFAATWLSILVIALPDVLYYNTGWYQFGDRFSLDCTPFLLILVALGLRPPLRPIWRGIFVVLLVLSIASNVVGMRWFLHQPPY